MNSPHTRREFLADVSRGKLVATVGFSAARELGLTPAVADETVSALTLRSGSFRQRDFLVSRRHLTPITPLH